MCLVRDLFTKEEMCKSNTSGRVSGQQGVKEKLDEKRLQQVRNTTMCVYGVLPAMEESAWRDCTRAINEACRRKPKSGSVNHIMEGNREVE